MPSRILREGIITSERVNSLSVDAELFYRRLMSVADDYGRYYAHPGILRAACYPLRLDSVSEQYVKQALSECVACGVLVLYGGGKYLQMVDFRQQTRAKSKFPQPTDVELLSKCEANALVFGVGVVSEVGGVGVVESGKQDGPPPQLSDEATTAEVIAYLQSSHRSFRALQDIHIASVLRKYSGADQRKIVEAVRTLVVHYAGDADLEMPATKRLDTYLRREVNGNGVKQPHEVAREHRNAHGFSISRAIAEDQNITAETRASRSLQPMVGTEDNGR